MQSCNIYGLAVAFTSLTPLLCYGDTVLYGSLKMTFSVSTVKANTEFGQTKHKENSPSRKGRTLLIKMMTFSDTFVLPYALGWRESINQSINLCNFTFSTFLSFVFPGFSIMYEQTGYENNIGIPESACSLRKR